jgi:hypothetical protein
MAHHRVCHTYDATRLSAFDLNEAKLLKRPIGGWKLIRASNRTADGHDLVSSTATASTSATTASISARPCFIDIEISAFKLMSVQAFDRGTGFISGGHFDETKPFGLTTVFVFDNRRRIDFAVGFKRLSQLIIGDRKR